MQKRKPKPVKADKLEKIFYPKGNIAFLDAEFNTGMDYKSGEKICDIISLGIVICDANYQGMKKYYSLVSPLSRTPIFPVIAKMTGITTAMLSGQPDFAEMSNKVTELVKKYNIEAIYTWGAADGHSLALEKEAFRRSRKPGYQASGKWNYITMCTDISGDISRQMLGISGGLSINVENLMFLCEIDEKQEHNALSDAYNLYRCMKYLRGHFPIDRLDFDFVKKRQLVNAYYQERSTYNSFRRFRSSSKGNDLYGKWGTDRINTDLRIKALEDDIKFLKGEIPYDLEFDSIQEYFSKEE